MGITPLDSVLIFYLLLYHFTVQYDTVKFRQIALICRLLTSYCLTLNFLSVVI
ncbi:hypothetical protein TOT_030000952 [Theileria orientalis strain Shintoku]|uniref:Uncharacterized protein n=1 Tax=Theileria orientalis strain Shintoku TaxID=869250 RepID=J4C8X7_THEOR|nr:hypothetical protein TOT_030000952 [Theileria orientalis strain Shintoku]BAM41558.1 hypothetical protein TOT_030000952 [Theileria orientalis strain Shintoku]|eukprot:XP_009691859.1 hypothetical protein TOT_030000952 [Theileria orientalis strain Shintoku]